MTETKQKIRIQIKNKRSKLTEKDVQTFSKKILKHLTSTKEFKKAKTILLYYPIQNEVNPLPLIPSPNIKGQKKNFALIRICKNNRMHIHEFKDPKTLKTGKFGVKEPISTSPKIPRKNLDLVITPGIAFDLQGNRIGYGKGYFDKLFKTLSTDCVKIALAYDFQIIENVPADKHDKKVDLIITEKRTIKP